MDCLEAILTRRSVRTYTSQTVDEATVKDLLRAAMQAPSAGNEQPWQFVVITERRLLDAVPKFHANAQMLTDAPLAILVCGDKRLEKYPGYWVQDCSAATQNILLAAHAIGLGAVWLGVYPLEDRVKATRELLGIPEEVVPFALISIGHPTDRLPTTDRYEQSRVHNNAW